MAKSRLGTFRLGGLDVSVAAHEISPDSLTVSENGWTEQEGSWRTAKGPNQLYTGYSAISAFAAGRRGGADRLVWLDGNTLYEDGLSVGTVNAGSDMYIRDFDDKFYIMGSSDNKNFVWDGNHVREHGPWQPRRRFPHSSGWWDVEVAATGGSAQLSVTAITKASSAVVSFTDDAAAEAFWTVGDLAFIKSAGGMTEINDTPWRVTAIDKTANTMTLDCDSTSFTTYTSGGTIDRNGCGLGAGTYKFMCTCIVELGDGTILESRPRLMRKFGNRSSEDTDYAAVEADGIEVSATTDVIYLYVNEYMSHTPDGYDYDVSGVVGTDWKPGFRVYRTKVGGNDFFLQMQHLYDGTSSSPDDYVEAISDGDGSGYALSSFSGGGHSSFGYVLSGVLDADLGAVYTPGNSDLGSPPQASLMQKVGRRLWMNDLDNPRDLRYTFVSEAVANETDYVPATNRIPFPDVITCIGSAGDAVIVMSVDRMWRVTLLGGLPDVDEIETDVGTEWGRAIDTGDHGFMFLRTDGLWVTNGASPPVKVSRGAFETMSTPVSVTNYGDTLYLGGTTDAFVSRTRDGGRYWHASTQVQTYADATNSRFYAADANTVYELFAGAHRGGAVETKTWVFMMQDASGVALPREMSAVECVIDVEGDTNPVVFVNGNRVSDHEGHEDESIDADGSRRLVRLHLGSKGFGETPIINHSFTVRVELSGCATLYGVWLECE